MFSDQTSSNIVWWPNMLMLKWVAKRLIHVSSNTDQALDTTRWANVEDMRAPNMFETAVQMNKTSPIKHENKRSILSCLIKCLMAGLQILSNTTKQHQTKWPNGKMFGYQAIIDGVWSPSISRWTGLYDCCVIFVSIQIPKSRYCEFVEVFHWVRVRRHHVLFRFFCFLTKLRWTSLYVHVIRS